MEKKKKFIATKMLKTLNLDYFTITLKLIVFQLFKLLQKFNYDSDANI